MGPGPPPLGPMGPWPRGFGGSKNPQLKAWEVTVLDFFIAQNHVVFDVDFWLFWARSWIPLGAHFRSFWRLGRPKLVPKPSSNRLNIEKVIVHETIRFIMVWGVFRPKMAPQDGPRSPQDESKIVLDRFF